MQVFTKDPRLVPSELKAHYSPMPICIDFDFGFRPNSEFHKYDTRQKDNLHLPLIRKSWGRQRLTYTAIKDWNSLDKDLRNIQCETTFKSRLRAKVCNP